MGGGVPQRVVGSPPPLDWLVLTGTVVFRKIISQTRRSGGAVCDDLAVREKKTGSHESSPPPKF